MYENYNASTRRESSGPRFAGWQGVLIGIGAGIVGLLPHVLAGARLPLQNLWRADRSNGEMPISLLPISHYYLWTLLVLLAMGGALGGVAFRLLTRYRDVPRRSFSGGIFALQALVVAQGFFSLAHGLQLGTEGSDSRSFLYFGAMLAVAVLGVLLAQLVFWLVSSRSTLTASLGFALMAVPSGSWLTVAVAAFTGESSVPLMMVQFSRWLPGILVGIVLAWCGLRSFWHALVWGASLVSLWLIPSTSTAIQYVVGSRAVLTDPRGMLESGVSVWSASMAVGVGPVLLATAIGAAVTALRYMGARSKQASMQHRKQVDGTHSF